MTSVPVPVSGFKSSLIGVLRSLGHSDDAAECIADVIMFAELRG